MKIELPMLKQEIEGGELVSTEQSIQFDVDTSVYSEERWEQNFPILAEHEGLFSYIDRIQQEAISERVKVASMLKAIYCFIESDAIRSYKEFAKMFILSAPEYTERLITKLHSAFKLILGSSSVKN